jgi:hypothetical protein
MKVVALIILMLFLLQPLASVAFPCATCSDRPVATDTSDTSGSHSHSQDVDSCGSHDCGDDCIKLSSAITVIYAPLVVETRKPERNHDVPNVVMPIFIPPQIHA